METEAISNCTCGGRSEIRGAAAPCGPADNRMVPERALDPFEHPAHQGFDRRHDRIVVPEAVSPRERIRVLVGRKPEGPWRPGIVLVGGQKEVVLPLERIADRRERMAGRAVQRLVRDPHEGEGVVIGSRPDMKTVLLDPLSVFRITSARGLAAKAPAKLVHRDVVFFAPGIDFGQRERSAHGAHAAAQHRNLDLAVRHGAPAPVNLCRQICTSPFSVPSFLVAGRSRAAFLTARTPPCRPR